MRNRSGGSSSLLPPPILNAGRPDPWSSGGAGHVPDRPTSLSRSLPLLSTDAPALSSPSIHPSILATGHAPHLFLRPTCMPPLVDYQTCRRVNPSSHPRPAAFG